MLRVPASCAIDPGFSSPGRFKPKTIKLVYADFPLRKQNKGLGSKTGWLRLGYDPPALLFTLGTVILFCVHTVTVLTGCCKGLLQTTRKCVTIHAFCKGNVNIKWTSELLPKMYRIIFGDTFGVFSQLYTYSDMRNECLVLIGWKCYQYKWRNWQKPVEGRALELHNYS